MLGVQKILDELEADYIRPPDSLLYRLVRCKHGLIACTCGVCTNHEFSVAVKGGHVVGSSSGSPTDLTNPAFGWR